MKTFSICLSFLFVFSLSSFKSFSQYSAVKIDAVGFVDSELIILRGAYERSLNKTLSVGLGVEKGKLTSGSDSRYGSHTVSAIGITPEIRAYPFNYYKNSMMN